MGSERYIPTKAQKIAQPPKKPLSTAKVHPFEIPIQKSNAVDHVKNRGINPILPKVSGKKIANIKLITSRDIIIIFFVVIMPPYCFI